MSLDPKYESVVGNTENHVIGLVYGGRDNRPQTDVFQLVTDTEGNVCGLNFIKTYTSHLKVLIGRGNKFVCDTDMFIKSAHTGKWAHFYTLDLLGIVSGCFIDKEDILFGLDNHGKVVHFRH